MRNFLTLILIVFLFSALALSQPVIVKKSTGIKDNNFRLLTDATLTSIDHGAGPFSGYRWCDVAGYEYSASYRENYGYGDEDVQVQVTFQANDVTLRGQLSATHLKPNFAYQLKISGNSDDPSNEWIGLAGRWWQEEWVGDQWSNGQNLNNKGDGSSPNPNDTLYFARRDEEDATSPSGLNYRYTGYLVFDYFISDENGDAVLDFEANSSYHVLFNTEQRSRTGSDGPTKSTTFDPDPAQSAYSFDYPQSTMIIFGEWERLPVGGVTLELGDYDCQIILTEESFHGWPSESSYTGLWAAAMGANIQFTIGEEDDPLYVQLSSFIAESGNSSVLISWVTESEMNHAGFEILRSDHQADGYTSISDYGNNPDLMGQGNSSSRHEYAYIDRDVLPGQSYWYYLVDVGLDGQRTYHGPVHVYVTDDNGLNHLSAPIPEELILHPNYPNPFNPKTVISWQLAVGSDVDLSIFNVLGQKVATLVSDYQPAGSYKVEWDASSVASGIYFVVLSSQEGMKTGKIIYMK